MPLQAPPGALEAAYRKHCLRCLRAMSRDGVDVVCKWSSTSKKCSYCRKPTINGACEKIPDFAGEEYERLCRVLDGSLVDDARVKAVKLAAKRCARIIKIAASEAPQTIAEVGHGLLNIVGAMRKENVEQAAQLKFCALELKALRTMVEKGRTIQRYSCQ